VQEKPTHKITLSNIFQELVALYCCNPTGYITRILLQFLTDQAANAKRSIATVTL